MIPRPSAVALALSLLAPGAPAQDNPEDPSQSQTPDPQHEPDGAASLLEKPPSTGMVFPALGADDARPAIPGIALPDQRPAAGSLLPEGTYLLRRRGILVPIGDARWAFVFDADADAIAEPPMFIMPCLQLAEMIRLVRSRPDTITFFIDAEVFVYRGSNHLLPLRYDVGAREEGAPVDEEQAMIDANRTLGPEDRDPSVEALLERLERVSQSEGEGRVRTPRAGGAGDPLIADQTHVVSRRGRLVVTGDAHWSFMPDNDADAPTDGRPQPGGAFVLLPCLNTQELERLAERHAGRVTFIVSGAIFVFEGRNYLLPTMYLLERDRDGNLTPAQ